MADVGELTFSLYGVDPDNGLVRADVFAHKLLTFLDILKISDKQQNEKSCHEYLIVSLESGSAKASLRERPVRYKKQRRIPGSSVRSAAATVSAVAEGRALGPDQIPYRILRGLESLTKDAGTTFAHGEIQFEAAEVIRIDDYLAQRTAQLLRRLRDEQETAPKYFIGTAYTGFDGVLKELDARGQLLRGKLILTAGGKEIDCIFDRQEIPIEKLRIVFDSRARIEGLASYSGDSPLPERVRVKQVAPIKVGADLLKWKGALDEPEQFDGESI
jgi:hypothetical protein